MERGKIVKKQMICLCAGALGLIGFPFISAQAATLDTQIAGAGISVVLEQYYSESINPQDEISAMLALCSSSEGEEETEETAAEEELAETADPLSEYYDTVAISQVSSYVNVRTEPNTESEIVGKLYDQCAATILGTEGEWYQIQSGSVEGYVKACYFVTGEEAKELALKVGHVVAKVTANILNVREEQGEDGHWMTTLENGSEVDVLEYGDNWVLVAVDDDVEGWVCADYVDIRVDFDTAISLEEEAAIAAEEAQRQKDYEDAMAALAAAQEKVTETETEKETETQVSDSVTFEKVDDTIYATTTVNIRKSYSTGSEKITSVSAGTALNRTGIGSNGWYRVKYNGGTYYVSADYFTTKKPESAPETTTTTQKVTEPETTKAEDTSSSDVDALRKAVVAYAKQFLGNPYVYGGTSLTNGTDCSGFTMSVYAHFGYSLNRASYAQANNGIPVEVSLSALEPGDLLFYSNNGTTIGHVTMYIGNGQVIHASTAKTGIKISTWNYRTPVCARRIIY